MFEKDYTFFWQLVYYVIKQIAYFTHSLTHDKQYICFWNIVLYIDT